MRSLKPITIVGGGLAGLSLGIALRQHGVPVVVWEAGSYPRHKVCGEFLSGAGQTTLCRLGLVQPPSETLGKPAHSVRFFFKNLHSKIQRFPAPGLAIPRFLLDDFLARTFQQLGGHLIQNARWKDQFQKEGLVRANGRRIAPPGNQWHWIGLKAHATAITLSADLEIHFVNNGYVGLARLPSNHINVCGLFRTLQPSPELHRTWPQWLAGPPQSHLHQCLQHAQFDPQSFCSVSGFHFGLPQKQNPRECAIGDAFAMIPPIAGNGMSMAFESANLAFPPLLRYAQNQMSWIQTCQTIQSTCRHHFQRRLSWTVFLHPLLFAQPVLRVFVSTLVSTAASWRLFFRYSR